MSDWNKEFDTTKFDDVEYTIWRHIILFMCKYPIFRVKWFLRLNKNKVTHRGYRKGKIVEQITVGYFCNFI